MSHGSGRSATRAGSVNPLFPEMLSTLRWYLEVSCDQFPARRGTSGSLTLLLHPQELHRELAAESILLKLDVAESLEPAQGRKFTWDGCRQDGGGRDARPHGVQ
jgi:hypothetical protein